MAEKSGKSVEHCDFVCIENLYTNTSTLRARAQLGKSVIPMPTHRVIGRLAIQEDGRWDVEVKFVKANEVQKLSEKPPSLQPWRKVRSVPVGENHVCGGPGDASTYGETRSAHFTTSSFWY